MMENEGPKDMALKTELKPCDSQIPDMVFHVTSKAAARNIFLYGLPPGSPWARADVAAYHARLLAEAGHDPLVLGLPVSSLGFYRPEPDWSALDAPPPEVVLEDTAALARAWVEGDPTWERSLTLVGSFRCVDSIPSGFLRTRVPGLDGWGAPRQRLGKKGRRARKKLP